jgi:hypothetical protein
MNSGFSGARLGTAHRFFERLVVELVQPGDAGLLAERDPHGQGHVFVQACGRNAVAREAHVALALAVNRDAAFVGFRKPDHSVADAFCFFLVQLFHRIFP